MYVLYKLRNLLIFTVKDKFNLMPQSSLEGEDGVVILAAGGHSGGQAGLPLADELGQWERFVVEAILLELVVALPGLAQPPHRVLHKWENKTGMKNLEFYLNVIIILQLKIIHCKKMSGETEKWQSSKIHLMFGYCSGKYLNTVQYRMVPHRYG